MRIGIITRRFWPYCGPLEMEAADVAQAIVEAGHEVEILTIQWDRNWPDSFRFRELIVTRFSRRLGGPWGMFRYLRDLNSYIKEGHFDALIIYGLADESWAALRNFLHVLPVGLRLDRSEWNSFTSRRFHFRQRRILSQVSRIWVEAPETQASLLQYHLPGEIVDVIPPCIQIPADFDRSHGRKTTLRTSLSDTHPILELEPHHPFAVCACRLDDEGIEILLVAWKSVLRQLPRARLWILGDGLLQHQVWQRVCEGQIAHSVTMPGQFDQIEELLVAADLYIHPLLSNARCHRLARALATGCCVVAVENELTREWIQHDLSGILARPNDSQALAESLLAAFGNTDYRGRLGSAARLMGQTFSVHNWVADFLKLV